MLNPAALAENKQKQSPQKTFDKQKWQKLWDEEYSKSFTKFLWLTWLHLDHAAPTPIQNDIGYFLQYGPQRTCIEALRGLGKSYITCAYAAWRLRLNPDEIVLIVSAAEAKAKENATFIRELIYSMPILEPLRLTAREKKTGKRKWRDSVLEFDVRGSNFKQSASVTCAGIEGKVTGKRSTIIILDDIEDPQNAISITQREKIKYLATEFEAIVKPGKNNRIIYLGTPHSSASIYTELPQKGYEVCMWPAEVPDAEWMRSYGQFLGPCIHAMIRKELPAGTPTDPRFPEEELTQRRISMPSRYDSQFKLDPKANDNKFYPFKIRDLIVMDCDPVRAPISLTWSSDERYRLDINLNSLAGDACYTYMYADPRQEPYEYLALAIDPSGKGKDKTAVCVMGMLHGKLHCLELIGLDGGFEDEVLEKIAELAFEYRVNIIYSETNFGGGMFDKLLAPKLRKYEHHGWTYELEQVHSTGQKEQRICDTCEPFWAGHKYVMNKNILVRDQEIHLTEPYHTMGYQFTNMTRERGAVAHDDLADVFYMATACIAKRINLSEKESLIKRDKAEKDEFWEEIYARVDKTRQNAQKTFLTGTANRRQIGMFN